MLTVALAFQVDTLDAVPEAFRSEYTEKDGKFVLAVEGIEDTTGLKTALDKERKAAREAAQRVKQYEGLGLSADEIKALVEDRQKAEREKATKEGNFDALLNQHKTNWEKEKASLEAELNAARQSERGAVIETSVMGALTKANATEEGAELLPEILARRIKFETEDGKRVIRVMQADGVTPMAGTAKDGFATIDDLVKEATSKFPSLFKASGVGGGGKPPSSSAGGAGKKSMSLAEFNRLDPRTRAARMAEGLTLTD